MNALTSARFLIPGQLAFCPIPPDALQSLKQSALSSKVCFASSSLHNQYAPFCDDFGPVNLGIVHRFCKALMGKLEKCRKEEYVLLYHFECSTAATANASFLLSAFMVLQFKQSPHDAAAPFISEDAPFRLRPFRDASPRPQTHELTLLDCLSGIQRAVGHDWFDLSTFDLETYDALDNPAAGDINQICPKFVAFKGPISATDPRRYEGEIVHSAAEYAEILSGLGVSCVVRLNDPDTYDKRDFIRHGINHYDLFFDDCTNPTDDVVEAFLNICDDESLVAVHCRAGLGRTGTLIALWMMRHRSFTSAEAIAWLRIVRPGSVIGPQQEYLVACERWGWAGNRIDRSQTRVDAAEDLEVCGDVQLAMGTSRELAKDVMEAISQRGQTLAQRVELLPKILIGDGLEKSSSLLESPCDVCNVTASMFLSPVQRLAGHDDDAHPDSKSASARNSARGSSNSPPASLPGPPKSDGPARSAARNPQSGGARLWSRRPPPPPLQRPYAVSIERPASAVMARSESSP